MGILTLSDLFKLLIILHDGRSIDVDLSAKSNPTKK